MREKIHEPITFQVYPYSEYRQKLVWKDLIATEGLLPDDVVEDITWDVKKGEYSTWGQMDDEPARTYTHYSILVTVKRWREETDDEYLERMRKIKVDEDKKVAEQKLTNEKEKLEYLRLKAKFEENEKNDKCGSNASSEAVHDR